MVPSLFFGKKMCEILIMLKDRSEKAQDYKLGDIVIVRPNGHRWGKMESKQAFLSAGEDENDWPLTFAIVKIPDLAVELAKSIHEAGRTDENGVLIKRSGVTLKNIFKEQFSSLREELFNIGQCTISQPEFLDMIA